MDTNRTPLASNAKTYLQIGVPRRYEAVIDRAVEIASRARGDQARPSKGDLVGEAVARHYGLCWDSTEPTEQARRAIAGLLWPEQHDQAYRVAVIGPHAVAWTCDAGSFMLHYRDGRGQLTMVTAQGAQSWIADGRAVDAEEPEHRQYLVIGDLLLTAGLIADDEGPAGCVVSRLVLGA